MNFKGFLKYLTFFKFKLRFDRGRGQSGSFVNKAKTGFFYRKNNYNNIVPQRASITPFLVRKYLINNFRRNKAYIFFFDGSLSIIPFSDRYCIGGIHYNELTRRYGLLSDYRFGTNLS